MAAALADFTELPCHAPIQLLLEVCSSTMYNILYMQSQALLILWIPKFFFSNQSMNIYPYNTYKLENEAGWILSFVVIEHFFL